MDDNTTPKSPKGDFTLAQSSKAQTLKAPFRGLGVIWSWVGKRL
jgi:hypothetical protein